MAQKKSKAKKPRETMRQAQRRKLAEQKKRKSIVKSKASKPASQRIEKVRVKVEPQKSLPPSKQKALPAGKKGGSLASTKGPRRRNINRNASKGTQMGTKGSAKAQLRLPKGTIRSAGAASKALSTTGKVAGRVALPLAAYSEGKNLYDSLKRGEGYARLPGMIGRALKGNGKNKTTGAKTNSRGRRVGAVPASKTKPAKKSSGKSNNAASINARLKKQRDARKDRLAKTKGGSNSSILRSAPGKGDPKRTPTRTTTSTPGRSTTYRRPSTSQGPTKAGSFYRSKGATTKGGPTKSGSSYAGKRKPRTWLKDNYKPGGRAKSTAGKTNNKVKQSDRMANALKNLKVRKYKK